MWALIVVILIILAPGLMLWHVHRHPAVRGPEPPRQAPPPLAEPRDAQRWLAERYGLGFAQRMEVAEAVNEGKVVDPDELRPAAVAFARHLIEQRSPHWRRNIKIAWMGTAIIVGPVIPVEFALLGGVREMDTLTFLAACGIVLGVIVGGIIIEAVDPPDLFERAERLNAQAPPGPGPDHPSRVRQFKWTA